MHNLNYRNYININTNTGESQYTDELGSYTGVKPEHKSSGKNTISLYPSQANLQPYLPNPVLVCNKDLCGDLVHLFSLCLQEFQYLL